jgi:hypothetical protein
MQPAGSSGVSCIAGNDVGRAVNAGEPDWPATLRGKTSEIYFRWERDLRPPGFRLGARVFEFSGRHVGRYRTVPHLGASRSAKMIDLDQFRDRRQVFM